MFDVSKLTLGEIATVEELSGLSVDEISATASPKGKMLAACAFVMLRRSDPTATFNMAMGLSMTEATALLSAEDDTASVDPTNSDEPPSSEPTD